LPRGLRLGPCHASAFIMLLLLSASVAIAENAAPIQSSHSAKNDYALIYGTVWGPDNHPVAGVPIKIRRASDKKAKWELVSDRNGEFAQRVPVGTQDYVIQADIKTPKGQPKPETTVHIEGNERQDVGIHLKKEELSAR
jgi:hypothetical protein